MLGQRRQQNPSSHSGNPTSTLSLAAVSSVIYTLEHFLPRVLMIASHPSVDNPVMSMPY